MTFYIFLFKSLSERRTLVVVLMLALISFESIISCYVVGFKISAVLPVFFFFILVKEKFKFRLTELYCIVSAYRVALARAQ